MILRHMCRLLILNVVIFCLKFPLIPAAGEPRIINGELAAFNNTKHQVSIRIKSKDYPFGNGHVCGGSLIGQKKVLTAAHCIFNNDKNRFREPRELAVVMGTLNRFKSKGTIISDVKSVATLKTFDIKTMTDDLAILFLKNGVPQENKHLRIKPIQLNNFTLPIGALCEVSGWGKTDSNNKELPAELRITNVMIVGRRNCSIMYGSAIKPGMLCAGYMQGGNDACQGDSGGPLVFKGSLVGVVSWGSGCGQRMYPGVYSDVKYYINWITKTNASGKLSWSISTMIIGIVTIVYVISFF